MTDIKNYFSSNVDKLIARYDYYHPETIHRSWINDYDFNKKSILDVGCGSGRDALYLAQAGANVLGVDFTKEMIDLAAKKDKGNRVSWVCDALPLLNRIKDIKFDFILVSAVLMFLNPLEQKQTIQRLFGLLKAGGSLIITFKDELTETFESPLFSDFIKFSSQLGFHVKEVKGGGDLSGRPINWRVYILRKAGF